MAKVIIETLDHNRLPRYCRGFDRLPLNVGRAYDNDVILLDPYICAHHIIVGEDGGGWFIEDTSTHNGTYINGKKMTSKKVYILSGDTVTIGNTRLRILSPHHPTKPVLRLTQTNKIFKGIRRPLWAFVLTAVLILLDFLDLYLESDETLPFQRYFWQATIFIVLVIIWVSIWAFVGRLMRHRTQFAALLSTNVIFILFLYVASTVSSHIGFIFSSNVVELSVWASFFGIGFAVLLFENLTIATRLSFRKKIIASIGVTALIFLTITLAYFAYKDEFNPTPEYYKTIKPPYVKPLRVASPDQFIEKGKNIFKALEKELKSSKNK